MSELEKVRQDYLRELVGAGWVNPIRCAECVHAEKDSVGYVCFSPVCNELPGGILVDADSYCSDGERRYS